MEVITRDNVKNLRILWRRPALDPRLKEQFPKLRTNNYLRATPTMIGGVLYAPDAAGLFMVTGYNPTVDVANLRARPEQTRTPNCAYFQGPQAQAQALVVGVDGDGDVAIETSFADYEDVGGR